MAIKIKYFKTRFVRYPALVAAVLSAIVVSGFSHDLSKADWGTWVGAVGTIGTLLGTMWIANTETRRRHRQEITRSMIVASALAPRLQQLASEIGSFRVRLALGEVSPGGLGTPREEADHLLAIKYVEATTEELIALEAMPNNCATKLAYAQSKFASVRSQVESYLGQGRPSFRQLSLSVSQQWQDWGSDLESRFLVLARQCEEAANIHATPPTQAERFGEPDDSDASDF